MRTLESFTFDAKNQVQNGAKCKRETVLGKKRDETTDSPLKVMQHLPSMESRGPRSIEPEGHPDITKMISGNRDCGQRYLTGTGTDL